MINEKRNRLVLASTVEDAERNRSSQETLLTYKVGLGSLANFSKSAGPSGFANIKL